MRYSFKPSFDRAFKNLSPDVQKSIEESISDFLGCLTERKPFSKGLGFKTIAKDYYEIRADIKVRIIFEMASGFVEFYFVGNHDQVRRFIRN